MEAANKPLGEGDGRKYDDLLPEVRVLQLPIHRGRERSHWTWSPQGDFHVLRFPFRQSTSLRNLQWGPPEKKTQTGHSGVNTF